MTKRPTPAELLEIKERLKNTYELEAQGYDTFNDFEHSYVGIARNDIGKLLAEIEHLNQDIAELSSIFEDLYISMRNDTVLEKGRA